MRTVELLEQAIETAEKLGYHVRHEFIGGSGGGACEFGGKKWLFIDLALSIDEQLEQITDALHEDPSLDSLEIGRRLASHLGKKRAA